MKIYYTAHYTALLRKSITILHSSALLILIFLFQEFLSHFNFFFFTFYLSYLSCHYPYQNPRPHNSMNEDKHIFSGKTPSIRSDLSPAPPNAASRTICRTCARYRIWSASLFRSWCSCSCVYTWSRDLLALVGIKSDPRHDLSSRSGFWRRRIGIRREKRGRSRWNFPSARKTGSVLIWIFDYPNTKQATN